MQPDAEHQQNDADLGELVGDFWSAAKPGGTALADAGRQIADQRRYPDALRQRAENESQHKAGHDRRNEGDDAA